MSAAAPEFRKPVMTWVEASWEDPGGASQTAAARMENTSAGGACIRVKTPISVGSKLRIQWRFEQFSGTARYCRGEGTEYLVGIQRDLTQSPVPNPVAAAKPVERPPTAPTTIGPVAVPAHGLIHEDHEDRPRRRYRDYRMLRRNEIPIKQPPQQVVEERKRMTRKWLDLPWSNKQEGAVSLSPASGNGGSNHNDKEEFMLHSTQAPEKDPVHAAREVPAFQVELTSMEDIYRAAGIMVPRKGYSIKKVIEMLNSGHMSGLAKEMKRVALLMALDAAGVPIDEVLEDARIRQQALDAYEAAQKKQVEAEWARKAEEAAQIQEELESIKAHYAARITRNQEGVAREKATFSAWLALKQQESQSMAEAAELCVKPEPVSEPASLPPAARVVKAAGADGARQESRSNAIQ